MARGTRPTLTGTWSGALLPAPTVVSAQPLPSPSLRVFSASLPFLEALACCQRAVGSLSVSLCPICVFQVRGTHRRTSCTASICAHTRPCQSPLYIPLCPSPKPHNFNLNPPYHPARASAPLLLACLTHTAPRSLARRGKRRGPRSRARTARSPRAACW